MSGAAMSANETDLRNFAARHVLPRGTPIVVRVIRPDDKARLLNAFGNLESGSIYTRFFHHKTELTEAELKQATEVDFDRVVALVVTVGSGETETIIAGGRYICLEGPVPLKRAEVAFVVEEDYQGQGIAGLILDHLARIARSRGIVEFDAEVLAANRPMLTVFARSGLTMLRQQADNVINVALSLAPPPP
jgi:GNAT superfamily N-acetyltransferase